MGEVSTISSAVGGWKEGGEGGKGGEGGREEEGRKAGREEGLVYIDVGKVYIAAASVSLSVVTQRISVSVLLVWHLRRILDSLLKTLMLHLKIKKLISSAHVVKPE